MKNNNKEQSEHTYPMRINKRVALLGIATRKEADNLIKSGSIFINGEQAKIGDLVNEHDIITTNGGMPKKYVYYAYNKPANIVTVSAQFGERAILDIATFNEEVFPVGRLDKDSTGLILITNDGRVTDRLLSPKFEHEKEYRVTVTTPITHSFLVGLRNGVKIGKKEITRKCKVRRTSTHTFEIVLTEGKNRQIRRMCGAFGYAVKKLERIRIMNIELGKLRPNAKRAIKGQELDIFLHSIGL